MIEGGAIARRIKLEIFITTLCELRSNRTRGTTRAKLFRA